MCVLYLVYKERRGVLFEGLGAASANMLELSHGPYKEGLGGNENPVFWNIGDTNTVMSYQNKAVGQESFKTPSPY